MLEIQNGGACSLKEMCEKINAKRRDKVRREKKVDAWPLLSAALKLLELFLRLRGVAEEQAVFRLNVLKKDTE